jgi:hypothetical protein
MGEVRSPPIGGADILFAGLFQPGCGYPGQTTAIAWGGIC